MRILQKSELASGSQAGTIHVWDVESGSGEARKTLKEGSRSRSRGRLTSRACLPAGDLVSGHEDATIQVWQVETGERQREMSGGRTWCVRELLVLPSGELASASEDETVRIWNLETSQEVAELGGHKGGASVGVSAQLACGGSTDNVVRIWTRHETVLGFVINTNDCCPDNLSWDSITF